MIEQGTQSGPAEGTAPVVPRQTRLKRILTEKPEARPRLRIAVVSLLETALATIVILGMLLIWHLRRRAELIRERLAAPRPVSLPGAVGDGDDSPSPSDRVH